MLLKRSGETNPKKTYRILLNRNFLKNFQMVWSLPLGFENTYALAVQGRGYPFSENSLYQPVKRAYRLHSGWV